MKRSHKSILSRLDGFVRWTGFTAGRVADDISAGPTVDRNHRPLRWIPLFYIAFSCALLIFYLTWAPMQNQGSLGADIGIMTGMMLSLMTGASLIYAGGPLGKAASEDDEREAALRKDSFLFCLGLLAVLNCLGQPVLLLVSHWQNWQTGQIVDVVCCVLILNATLLAALPTLYASWNFRQPPTE